MTISQGIRFEPVEAENTHVETESSKACLRVLCMPAYLFTCTCVCAWTPDVNIQVSSSIALLHLIFSGRVSH